ncbi:MAG: YbhB/YbcL family Raf kinase inhibitor-like protein [Nevskia sp.]|nr:YbhB/YbcL family Raf kinase inhibitor-like protein [Nevskia sp.]
MPIQLLLRPLGRLLRGVRAGTEGLLSNDAEIAAVAPSLRLTSAAFADGGAIPPQYCGELVDRSPPLAWSPVPAQTQSLALIMEDADAPWPRPLLHVLVFGISPRVRALPEGALARQPPADTPALVFGYNALGKRRYLAPAALPGHGPHRYYFQLLALDIPLSFRCAVRRREALAAIKGHVLARGTLMGTLQR